MLARQLRRTDSERVRSARTLVALGALGGFALACCLGLLASALGRRPGLKAVEVSVVLSLPVMRAQAPHPVAGRERQRVHDRFLKSYMRLAQQGSFPAEVGRTRATSCFGRDIGEKTMIFTVFRVRNRCRRGVFELF